ncbi:uncharacterized protein M421DRAFT_416009 [Didymella exigua CBS 183.55]|uniref:CRIB domain-containing protein n=1 Tax=Didymella exigua CBS 183.55 TaxID=1150837 RepID=A0A6A5S231_9PLEO|nr:uncharacterized protein M421DRAFT_416009 [Didymella exigua CBS 183.55]KAF1933660.1 hypothetical protein M421DRAFT_416009 [Didymella exigua CBS 183.55]
MFGFHKNETLSRSRQSSIDSSVAEGRILTSVPDSTTASQCSADSDYTEGAHSPERRRRATSNRRNSVFNMRSRSNTAASTASSIMSSSHPDMASYGHTAPGSPPTLRHVPSHSRLDNNGSRRSMFRGKMGKRLSESVSNGVDADDYQEVEAGRKRASFLRKMKGANESETMYSDLKNRISSPFDFQHLTHADRHQVATLEQAPGSALVTGWAERAARMSASGPNSPRNMLTENLVASEAGYASPPQSPHLREWQQSDPSASRQGLRLTRSVESFSQPGVNIRNHRHSSSVIAPPRTSSLGPKSSIHNIPKEEAWSQASTSRSRRQSGIWDAFALSTGSTSQLPGIAEDSTFVGNAVTTPDDSAIQAMTPPFSPSLDDVAEEPERFVNPRPAPQPSRLRSPTSPRSPFLESFSFNGQRSLGVKTRSRGNPHTSPRCSALPSLTGQTGSQISETLESPTLTRASPVPRPVVTRRKSNTWRAIEESWEDDVDYIYDNALEAECDNDWDCVSEDEGLSERHHALTRAVYEERFPAPRPAQQPPQPPSKKPTFRLQLPFVSSRLLLDNDNVPELGSASGASASTTTISLQTPFHESEGFILSPSLLLPQAYKEPAEASYEDILKEYDGSDCHFPIMDLDESATSSTRSSHVRFSRRSSYDSSLTSSAQSSGLWSSPIRRSASSAGSLPELVHSRRTRQNFNLIVDELSEQVAILEAFGSDNEEDDDVTPPGPSRRSAERSFFSSARDLANNESYQRNKQSHKQTLSDGVAHMLAPASTPKTRSRAATTSYKAGEEYLHLFPTPPSFSPPTTD